MAINELKTIEYILSNLTLPKDQQSRILPEDANTFTNSKINIFNTLTINTLLKYNSIDLFLIRSTFLENGMIPKVYNKVVQGPLLDLSYKNKPIKFYIDLFNALRDNEYYFDKDGNICINSSELTTVISPIWLHRLSEYIRNSKFKTVYLYNKNKNAKIYDEESLKTYLQQCKTFEITMDNVPGMDTQAEFNKAKKKTNNIISAKKTVKIEDVIETFEQNIPEYLNPLTAKFVMPTPIYITKKANEIGGDFYNAPILEQQEMISKWLSEYIHSNDLSNHITKKMLMQNSLDNIPHSYKQHMICGLHNALFTLLKHYDTEFDTVSLTNYKVDTYLSETRQTAQEELGETIEQIDDINNSKELAKLKKRIDDLIEEIRIVDADKTAGELLDKQQKINKLINDYKKIELKKEKYISKRNSLQSVITYHQLHDIDDIAFDNEKISNLIYEAILNGQVIINPLDNKKISVRLYSPTSGKIIFEANISSKQFLQLVEDINFKQEETTYKMAA